MEKTKSNKKAIKVLNELIEICKDGENGFKTAAEGLPLGPLQHQCLGYSEQRAEFARELQKEVARLGGDPEGSGSVAGSLHRGWIDIKAAVTNHDEDAIVAECERGEDTAKAAYEMALEESLPAAIAGLIQRQYLQVKEVHDRFSALQKAA